MIELRTYTKAELAEIFHTNDKETILRRLERNKISYSETGWGNRLQITITEISDPFRVYCVFDLGFPPQTDFVNLRYLYYYLFCCDDFAKLPLVEMENFLLEKGCRMSRQTIRRWINHLAHIDFIALDPNDCLYSAVCYREDGKKYSQEITREKYNQGWKMYWDIRRETGDCGYAYAKMRNFIGGHPYKKEKIKPNGIYHKEIAYLIELINESFLQESDT